MLSRRLARRMAKLASVAVLAATLVAGGSSASAESTVIRVYFQPIATNNQMLGILTDAPAGTPLDVFVNGKLKDTVPLRTYQTGEDYIRYKKSWGLGRLVIRDGDTSSKPVQMLAAIDLDRYELRRIGPGGKRVRVKVTAKRFAPAKNRWVKAPHPMLQAKKQGKWKNVRRIKLNKSGHGKVVIKPKKSYTYRFVVKKTKKNARAVRTTSKF